MHSIKDKFAESDSPIATAIAGMVTLAVAIGFGRFAFTPILPMMLRDSSLDLALASLLASANYAGYLVGALASMQQHRLATLKQLTFATSVKLGLLLTVVLTATMATGTPWVWIVARFSAGVVSAWVFINASTWCLSRIPALGRPKLAGLVFAGPGLGIVMTGLIVNGVDYYSWVSPIGWLMFALAASMLTAIAWPRMIEDTKVESKPAIRSHIYKSKMNANTVLFSVAYGLSGYGYIISATFLPVIARLTLSNETLADLFWPVCGVAAMTGSLLTIAFPIHWNRRLLLVSCYALQGTGIVIGMISPTATGYAVSSAMLGLPMTVIPQLAMQEIRNDMGPEATSAIGFATALYAIGQIAGPLFVAGLLRTSVSAQESFIIALASAVVGFIIGAMIFIVQLVRNQRSVQNCSAIGESTSRTS
jgi:MFS family permease